MCTHAKKSLNTKIRIMVQNIQTVVRGDAPGLILRGGSGLGKTYHTGKQVKGTDYVDAPKHSSPLGFYKFVYQYSRKLLVIDDDTGGFSDPKIQSFVKAMLYPNPLTGKNTIAWNSMTKILEKEGLPEEFDFEGKIIYVCNSLPDNSHTRAIKSRALTYEIDLSFGERKELILLVAKSGIKGLKKNEVVSFRRAYLAEAPSV